MREARREAHWPRQVSAAGWKAALKGALRGLKEREAVMVASSVTFFALLALFPAVIAFVSIYGLVMTAEDAQAHLQAFADAVPQRVHDILMAQVRSVTTKSSTNVWSAIASVGASLLGASNGTAVVMRAVGIAYDQPDERSFARRRGLALLLTLGFALASAVALAAIALLPALAQWLGLGPTTQLLIDYGRWPALALLMVVGLSVLYAVAPHRRPPRWRWLTWGSAVATALWLGVSMGFAAFVDHVGVFAEIYGTVAGVVVLMLWLFLSALVIMVGAELNAQLERQTTADLHRHRRGDGSHARPRTSGSASHRGIEPQR